MNKVVTEGRSTFEISDLDLDVLPGGASEPVLHVAAVIVVIGILWATPAY